MERLRDKVRTWFNSFKGLPTKEELEQTTPYNNDIDLFRETEEVFLLSALTGMDHASTDLELADEDISPEGISFEEASTFLKTRLPLTSKEWYDLEPKVRFRAFTVAALGEVDAIDKVKQRLLSTIEKGGTLEQFWNEQKLLENGGLAGRNPMYWETVYRTNMQTSYNAGRAMEFQRTQPEYLEFIGVEDERQTDICSKRSGIILPASHAFWKSNWPPLHFNCRSTVRPVPQEEIDYIKQTNPTWERTPDRNLPIGEDKKGFGENPLDSGSFFKITPGMADRIEGNPLLKMDLLEVAQSSGVVSDPIQSIRLIQQNAAVRINNQMIQDVIEERKIIKAELAPLIGKKVFVPSLSESVEISKKGIDHAFAFSASKVKINALLDLENILRKSILAGNPVEYSKGGGMYKEVIYTRVVIETGTQPRILNFTIFRRQDNSLVLYDVAERKIVKGKK